MRGSEKQIAWAEDIKENLLKTYAQFRADMEAKCPDEKIKAANLAGIDARVEAIKAAEYAGDLIDIFGDIHFTGNVEEDMPEILSVYRVHYANTPGQKAILCR